MPRKRGRADTEYRAACFFAEPGHPLRPPALTPQSVCTLNRNLFGGIMILPGETETGPSVPEERFPATDPAKQGKQFRDSGTAEAETKPAAPKEDPLAAMLAETEARARERNRAEPKPEAPKEDPLAAMLREMERRARERLGRK